MLFFVPEFKKYMSDKSALMGRSVLKTWLRFYLAAIIFFSLLRYSDIYGPKNEMTSTIINLTNLFVSLYIFHHSISQSIGLSITQYSQFLQNTNPNKKLVHTAIKMERKLATLLLFLLLALTAVVKFGSEAVKVFTLYMSLIILISYLISILLKVYKIDVQLFKLKLLFSSRYFLFLLYFLNSIAVAASTAIHGFEYFIVTKKIMSEAKLSYTIKSLSIYILLTCVFVFFTVRALILKVDESFFYSSHNSNFVDDISYVFVMSLSFIHFFIDSFIYKMSDAAVKSNQAIFFNLNVR